MPEKAKNKKLRQRAFLTLFGILSPALLLPLGYVFSILYRVSLAETTYFGSSQLIPLSFHPPSYKDAPTPESWGSLTYVFKRKDKKVVVYRQLINGFQHTYGSALTAYELGDKWADWLFRANEYLEELVASEKKSDYRFLDTRKDLANNKLGREIGNSAKAQGLTGAQAEQYMTQQVLSLMDENKILNHYFDARVAKLPTLEEYGCPYLSQWMGR